MISGVLKLILEPLEDLTGKHILVTEDVVDQGDSLEFLDHYFTLRGVASLKVATLHQKPHTKRLADFVGQVTTSWVVYPWEIKEFADTNLSAWADMGLTPKQGHQVLANLGFVLP